MFNDFSKKWYWSCRHNTKRIRTNIISYISEHIPVCIISSKDFEFLRRRERFASILSCVLGLETVNHSPHHNEDENNNIGCKGHQHLIAGSHSLMDNSKLLHNIL
jgi:hypothetical protein